MNIAGEFFKKCKFSLDVMEEFLTVERQRG